jgi:bacterioferritin-associated ferredoxin
MRLIPNFASNGISNAVIRSAISETVTQLKRLARTDRHQCGRRHLLREIRHEPWSAAAAAAFDARSGKRPFRP